MPPESIYNNLIIILTDAEKSPNILLSFIILFILTLFNAFFAAAEIATVSLDHTKLSLLAEEGNKKAKKVLKVAQDPNKFLSTIQVGITIAGIYSGNRAGAALSPRFANVLAKTGMSSGIASTLSTLIITLALTYVMIVLGELFPKRLALKAPEKVAMNSIGFISGLMALFKPFVWLLSISVKFLLFIFRVKIDNNNDQISEQELRYMIDTGTKQGTINEQESQMINSVFEFNDITAEEVMTPRTEVFMLDINEPLDNYLNEIIYSKYSRIPFYEDDIDNIIGVLYIKDLLISAKEIGFENIKIRDILRPAYFVPTLKKIDILFRELQSSKTHLAILIDEYGGFAGIVTIEDLMEEIFGNIYDEFDDDDMDIKKIDENTYSITGLIPIFELNEKLNLDIDEESDDYDTLAGFIISNLGYIPKENEFPTITYKNLEFKVEKVSNKRIIRVLLKINEIKEEKEEEEEENNKENQNEEE